MSTGPASPTIHPNEIYHERLVRAELLGKSGGGDLYRFRLGGRAMVYKHVHHTGDLGNVSWLIEQWAKLRGGTDWVRPEKLILDNRSHVTGYIMAEVAGKTLFSIQPRRLDLECLICRTAVAMQEAIAVGIFPLIEHGGNVMVREGDSGTYDTAAFIDADASRSLTPSDSERGCLAQLPIIFSNMDTHPIHQKLFCERNGIAEFRESYATLGDLIRDIMESSPKFAQWVQCQKGEAILGPVRRPVSDNKVICLLDDDSTEAGGLGHPISAEPAVLAAAAPRSSANESEPVHACIAPASNTNCRPDVTAGTLHGAAIAPAMIDPMCDATPGAGDMDAPEFSDGGSSAYNELEASEASEAEDGTIDQYLNEYKGNRNEAMGDWPGFIEKLAPRRAVRRRRVRASHLSDRPDWMTKLEGLPDNEGCMAGWRDHTPDQFKAGWGWRAWRVQPGGCSFWVRGILAMCVPGVAAPRV